MNKEEKQAFMKRIGSLGGKSTFRKYGSRYMSRIGRRGAISFWNKYNLKPIPGSSPQFAIVCKTCNRIIGIRRG